MSLKPLKYIGYDEGKGCLYSAGTRSLLLPVNFILYLNGIFANLVGRPAAQILIYKAGQAFGESYAETLKEIFNKEKIELDKETVLRESYNAISSQAGWGKIEIKELNLEKDKIVIKISNTISGHFLKDTQYNLEKGILAGIYKKIIGKALYFQIIKEDEKEKSVVFSALKEMPKGFSVKERLALLTRKELEEKIRQITKTLQERIKDLEKFHRLAVGRELKMVELKEEIKKLKEELGKYENKG